MFQSEIYRLKIVKLLQKKKKRIYRNENIPDDFSSFFGMRVEKFTRSKLWPSEIFHRKTQEQIIELECNERGTIPNNVSTYSTHAYSFKEFPVQPSSNFHIRIIAAIITRE